MVDEIQSDDSDGAPSANSEESFGREPPFSEFHETVEECIGNLNGRVKSCGRSAFRHLRGAWALFELDNEMSALRAITAEEEAASALILSLQQKRYPGSGLINHRDHLHKTALTPFLNAVRKVLSVTDFAKPTLTLKPKEAPPRVEVSFDIRNMGADISEPLFVQPDEPLNFLVHNQSEDGDRSVHAFEEELKEIATGKGLDDVLDFLRSEANRRNRLLYANDEGIPSVQFQEGFLRERLRRVTVLLVLTIAVQQTKIHQLFIVQCLKAFLRMMKKAEFALPKIFEDDLAFRVQVTKEDGGEPVLSIHRKTNVNITCRFLPIIRVKII